MADYSTVPQDVLNYFQNALPFDRYTDANGFQWIRNWEGGGGVGDSSDGGAQFAGYRRGSIANEANDPFRAEATNLYYNPQGQYAYTNTDDPGWLNPVTGVLAVVGAGLGAAALGGAAAAGSGAAGAGAAGAGEAAGAYGMGAGAASGADMAAFYGGLDGAATLGGGASVGGGSALGAAGGAGFLGDATAAGYGGLDAASASTMGGGASVNGGAALGGTSAMGAAPGGAGGTAPPANPYTQSWTDMLSNGVQNMGTSDWMGLATTALGAFGGAQGQENSQTTQNKMDPRLDPYIYGSLFPNAQGLMQAQMPIAGQNAQQLTSVGRGLLGTNVTPNLQDNPYLQGAADDMQRRTGNLLGTSLQQIQGNSVGVGGLGGSRQGVAQGEAMKGAADSLQGNLSNLYYNQYNQDANRNLAKITLGSGLLSQGQQAPWSPIQNASQVYQPYTGLNSSQTTSSQQGGGWMGALGGGLAAAQYAKNAGWW